MARSCGIRLGPRSWDLIVLEGSVKNPKVKTQLHGDIPPSDDPLAIAAGVLREELKTHNVPTDNASLVIDGGLAAYRTVILPFDDKSKTEQVIKFEVESELPQWDIDDVIVDFHVLDATGMESRVLVTAVPKDEIIERVGACERAGIEPLEVELEGTALVNAAQHAGLLSVDSAQVLVHIGEYSTSVAVVDGGKVREIRAIQTGAAVREEAPAPVAAGDDDTEPVTQTATVTSSVDLQRRLSEVRARLNRELGRTVAGVQTAQPIETVYVCGAEVPGLVGSEVMDVPVERLELFPSGGEDGGPPVVAFGTAWRQLGGGSLKPSLRREELRYAGKLERLELPLAVLSLLIVTLLAVKFIVVSKQINWRDEGNLAIGAQGDLQVWLEASNNYLEHNLPDMPDEVRQYMQTAEEGGDTQRTKFQELLRVRSLIQADIDRIRKILGQDADVTKPQSALEASTLVLGLLNELGEEAGRYSLRKFSATFQPGRRSGSPDRVQVKMDLSFFDEGGDFAAATRRYLSFKNLLREQPWCVELPDKGNDNLADGSGIFVDGFTCFVDLSQVERS